MLSSCGTIDPGCRKKDADRFPDVKAWNWGRRLLANVRLHHHLLLVEQPLKIKPAKNRQKINGRWTNNFHEN